ncbi:MAG: beta-agarase [Opitutales bacterium]|nr:beta-agarase [Opitutales bacterium]
MRLLKKLIVVSGIVCMMLSMSACKKNNIVIFDAENTPDKKPFIITDKTPFVIKGNWDLSKNLDFLIDVEEIGGRATVLKLRISEGDDAIERDSNSSIAGYRLAKGEKGEIIIEYPPLPAHPEIIDDMPVMRTNPMLRGDRSKIAKDYTKIKTILIERRNIANSKVAIKRVVALDTSKKKYPEYFSYTKEQFFPFVDKYGQFKFKDWKGKIKSDEDIKAMVAKEEKDLLANPQSPEQWSKYGGWKGGPKFEATGHFRVQKHNGKWWLIDPEGYLFWSHGVVRVTPSSAITPLDKREKYFEDLPSKDSPFALFYTTKDEILAPYYPVRGWTKTYDFSASNLYRKYGKLWREKFADSAHRRLKSWGLNTIANSSDSFIFLQKKTPYAERFEIHSRAISGSFGWWWPIADPWDPSFMKAINDNLDKRKEQLDDPFCIGYFVDNEHSWGKPDTIARRVLMSPADLCAKIELLKDLKAQYGDIATLNKSWKTSYKNWDDMLAKQEDPKNADKKVLATFSNKFIGKYFENIRKGIKARAPHMLYMGCRFAGHYPNELVVRQASKYCDIISYNIYADVLDELRLPTGVDKPIMIGEFHFGSLDRGLFHASLILTKNQKDRAQHYYDYVESALKHPNVIGTHWHQFSDQCTTGRFDGENFQVGFTDVADQPYEETIKKIREIGYKMYKTRMGK